MDSVPGVKRGSLAQTNTSQNLKMRKITDSFHRHEVLANPIKKRPSIGGLWECLQ